VRLVNCGALKTLTIFSDSIWKNSPHFLPLFHFFNKGKLENLIMVTSGLILKVLTLCFLFHACLQQLTIEERIGFPCSQDNVSSVCGVSLICSNVSTCAYCVFTDECREKSNVLSCKTSVNSENKIVFTCQHKDLFPNINWWDFGAIVSNFFGAIIATAGGIGGGGLYTPLLYGIGQFPLSLAVPLSKTLVLGGALASIIVLSQERHPEADRPIIDHHAATYFEPFVLVGSTVGVICNQMFPNWLIVSILLTILTALGLRQIYRAVLLCFEERKVRDAQSIIDRELEKEPFILADIGGVTDGGGFVGGAGELGQTPAAEFARKEEPKTEQEHQLHSLKQEETKVPLGSLLALCTVFLLLLLVIVFKGGHGVVSIVGVYTCSPAYWILFAVPFVIIVIFAIFYAVYLLRITQMKKEINYRFLRGDIQWNFWKVLFFPLPFFIAGFFASLLGIGSGMFKSPFLMEVGLDVLPASATSTYMIFYTSMFTVTQYAFLGRLPPDYALCFGVTGFIAALIGRYIVAALVKMYKIQSAIVFLAAIVTFASALLMGGVGIYRLVLQVQAGDYLGFKSPC